MELPEEDNVPVHGGVQSNWDLTNWYPEDATAEVWAGDESKGASDNGWIIELALHEHHIRSLVDALMMGLAISLSGRKTKGKRGKLCGKLSKVRRQARSHKAAL